MPRYADVAQLVAHHLAKVKVAGSNPVVRSERPRRVVSEAHAGLTPGGVAERRGNGLQSRLHGFKSRLHLGGAAGAGSSVPHHSRTARRRAIGAVWLARFLDTEEVTGSSPVSPTSRNRRSEALSGVSDRATPLPHRARERAADRRCACGVHSALGSSASRLHLHGGTRVSEHESPEHVRPSRLADEPGHRRHRRCGAAPDLHHGQPRHDRDLVHPLQCRDVALDRSRDRGCGRLPDRLPCRAPALPKVGPSRSRARRPGRQAARAPGRQGSSRLR